jgi:hypothetical protein
MRRHSDGSEVADRSLVVGDRCGRGRPEQQTGNDAEDDGEEGYHCVAGKLTISWGYQREIAR